MQRWRRLRKNASMRSLVQENSLSVNDLVMPLFVREGKDVKEEIKTLPNLYRYSIDLLVQECQELWDLGICSIALFPIIEGHLKDSLASESANDEGLYPRAIGAVKDALPEMLIFSDVAMDPYSSDGHDGVVENGRILNDETLPILAKMAVVQAKAGADVIAPSDMMDGRVAYLRKALDEAGFSDVAILSYAVKYASSFYGPFRDALASEPKFGDKKTYQMDIGNRMEAIREVETDISEGADFIMIKPGLAYLDIVRDVCQLSDVPVAVYNVSGEYAMLNFASQNGVINYLSAVKEVLLSFKRAGANIIFTYHAKEIASCLHG